MTKHNDTSYTNHHNNKEIPHYTYLKNTTSTHDHYHTNYIHITTTMHTPKTSSLPTTPNQPSTTTSKPQITPSKHTISPSEYLPFTFCLLPNCSSYISKLNLPMNLARLCTEIQCNVELSIIRIVEGYLTKQNKLKNGNKNKQ